MNESPRSPNVIIYLMIGIFSFVLGWQSTALGVIGGPEDVKFSCTECEAGIDGRVPDLSGEVDLGLFWAVWAELEKKYVDENTVEKEDRVYGAIKGLVASFDDPYTVFMTPEESQKFSDSLEGTLEGIGAELTVEENRLVIVSPLKNSPAEKAGLLPGDMIYLIEGEPASDMTLFDAIMSIRGEKGTSVKLTIIRETLDEPFEVSIVRDSIDLESVTIEKLDSGIIYLSVNQFNDKTNDQFRSAVSEMLLNKPSGLIIDLRYNGGGYLDIAVQLLSYLLPTDTESVIIRQRNSDDDIMYTNGNPKLLDIPLVVLVNEGSASASEIVAGAIQDHHRGILMGTQTFGKGSVQEVEGFADGSSLRITIAKWFTPDGRGINHVGLTPDIVVEISDEDIANEYDSQKEAAIEYLSNL